MIFNHFGLFFDLFRVASPGGAAFRGDGEMACIENFPQFAWSIGIHICTSSLTTFLGPPARSVDQSLMGESFS